MDCDILLEFSYVHHVHCSYNVTLYTLLELSTFSMFYRTLVQKFQDSSSKFLCTVGGLDCTMDTQVTIPQCNDFTTVDPLCRVERQYQCTTDFPQCNDFSYCG